jgi:hypothetical protein
MYNEGLYFIRLLTVMHRNIPCFSGAGETFCFFEEKRGRNLTRARSPVESRNNAESGRQLNQFYF